jgi:hypothetical protein
LKTRSRAKTQGRQVTILVGVSRNAGCALHSSGNPRQKLIRLSLSFRRFLCHSRARGNPSLLLRAFNRKPRTAPNLPLFVSVSDRPCPSTPSTTATARSPFPRKQKASLTCPDSPFRPTCPTHAHRQSFPPPSVIPAKAGIHLIVNRRP